MEINSGNKEVFERMLFILREKLINRSYSDKEISETLVLVALFLRDELDTEEKVSEALNEFKVTDNDLKEQLLDFWRTIDKLDSAARADAKITLINKLL